MSVCKYDLLFELIFNLCLSAHTLPAVAARLFLGDVGLVHGISPWLQRKHYATGCIKVIIPCQKPRRNFKFGMSVQSFKNHDAILQTTVSD